MLSGLQPVGRLEVVGVHQHLAGGFEVPGDGVEVVVLLHLIVAEHAGRGHHLAVGDIAGGRRPVANLWGAVGRWRGARSAWRRRRRRRRAGDRGGRRRGGASASGWAGRSWAAGRSGRGWAPEPDGVEAVAGGEDDGLCTPTPALWGWLSTWDGGVWRRRGGRIGGRGARPRRGRRSAPGRGRSSGDRVLRPDRRRAPVVVGLEPDRSAWRRPPGPRLGETREQAGLGPKHPRHRRSACCAGATRCAGEIIGRTAGF